MSAKTALRPEQTAATLWRGLCNSLLHNCSVGIEREACRQ